MDSSGNTGAVAGDGAGAQLAPATVQLTKPAPPPAACSC
jgi:acetyl esterase/lipase